MEVERLIEEVRRRPALFDNSLPTYLAKEVKPRLWLEVAQSVINDWDGMAPIHQEKGVLEVQKRWRTLRDNYKRELKHQKLCENGVVPIKRRKYKYFDELSFLGQTLDKRSKMYSEEDSSMQFEASGFLMNDIMAGGEGEELSVSVEEKPGRGRRGGGRRKRGRPPTRTIIVGGESESRVKREPEEMLDNEEEEEAEVEEDDGEEDINQYYQVQRAAAPTYTPSHVPAPFLLPQFSPSYDPDELFLLSLVPYFRRLSEEKKSLARVKITQLMHDLSYPPPPPPPPPPQLNISIASTREEGLEGEVGEMEALSREVPDDGAGSSTTPTSSDPTPPGQAEAADEEL